MGRGWRRGGSVGGVSAKGEFVRDTRYLNGRITAGGRDGTLPVEAGRYRLVVARACPWANRTMIVRRLLGLEPADVPGDLRARARLAELDVRP